MKRKTKADEVKLHFKLATENKDINRLEVILREIREAVVVCDSDAQILLYNSKAKKLLYKYPSMGLGQSLYAFCRRPPIEHILGVLKHRLTARKSYDPDSSDAQFVCSTVDGAMLLQCNVSHICFDTSKESIFVFTLQNMTRQINEMEQQGCLLDKMVKDLRAPITNLYVAAENIKAFPNMAPGMRREFEAIISAESEALKERFEALVKESENITRIHWPLFDVFSADLFESVISRFTKDDGIKVFMSGVPLWLHGDSYSLMLVLDLLVRFVRDNCYISEVEFECLLGDKRVYIDLIWKGGPVLQAEIDSILEKPLADKTTGMTVADVLSRHDSEIWSQKHRREGYSLLRIPVPDSPKQWEEDPGTQPDQPKFYDFSTIAETPGELGDLADQSLSSLNYVVFDTETTGLRPSEGDEILSIAAVRIMNGRILSGERFERLIKPQRPLPDSSLPFLEVTEESLKGESPAEVVLPQFMSFVADAIVVGHNPVIDIKFLENSGINFEKPVLDTLLMTIILDMERTDYTLSGISRWLGIEVPDSRTIMDDCFLTAQIFLRLVDLFEEKGIITFGDLLIAARKAAEEKRQQAH